MPGAPAPVAPGAQVRAEVVEAASAAAAEVVVVLAVARAAPVALPLGGPRGARRVVAVRPPWRSTR